MPFARSTGGRLRGAVNLSHAAESGALLLRNIVSKLALKTSYGGPVRDPFTLEDYEHGNMKRSVLIVCALLFSFVVPPFGYVYLRPLIAFLFLIGYVGSFFLWLLVPTKASYISIRAPYWATLLAFLLLHKVEENTTKFFEVV